MLLDAHALGSIVSLETGLEFKTGSREDDDRRQVITLTPQGYNIAHTFSIDIRIAWRRLEIQLVPGKFANPLLQAMSESDSSARAVFQAVLKDCENSGAKIVLSLNGKDIRYDEESIWDTTWRQLSLRLNKGSLELGTDEGTSDFNIVQIWASRFGAAVISLLPLEEYEIDELEGYPEGAFRQVRVNRYERDRRNRAAALAIHGHACFACGMNFGRTYGPDASGYIEVHHVVPVSGLGDNYTINPKEDLIPLCPNCHAVVHRRKPPFTITEIKELLRRATESSRSELNSHSL